MKKSRVQAVLVVVHGVGVLIRGRPGSGKSLAALNLMRQGHKLVSDDLVEVVRGVDGDLWGRSLEEDTRIEIRGLGIFNADKLFPQATASSSRIDLVIDLEEYDPGIDAGRIVPETGKTDILGKNMLTVRVPVLTGQDLFIIIELLAKRFKESGSVNP
ncbi:MAG: HPr kinase/phosphorylase [Desulfomonilaceae bacterium]